MAFKIAHKIEHQHVDRVGAGASMLCAMHCMLLPVLLTALPLLGLEFLGDHDFEAGVLIFTVTLAAASLCWGHRIHRDSRTLFLLAMAVSLFLTAHQLGHGDFTHAILMASGGITLVIGHVLNIKLCRSCHTCCDDHAE